MGLYLEPGSGKWDKLVKSFHKKDLEISASLLCDKNGAVMVLIVGLFIRKPI